MGEFISVLIIQTALVPAIAVIIETIRRAALPSAVSGLTSRLAG